VRQKRVGAAEDAAALPSARIERKASKTFPIRRRTAGGRCVPRRPLSQDQDGELGDVARGAADRRDEGPEPLFRRRGRRENGGEAVGDTVEDPGDDGGVESSFPPTW